MQKILAVPSTHTAEVGGKDTMYKNIVVGYDGSDYSKAALMEASKRVKKNGGKVTLVHAVYFDEEEFGIAPLQLDKRIEFGRNICMQAKEKHLSEFGVDVESLVCEGEPPDILTQVALGKEADLIALGTHGRKGLKRLLLGSVTSGVIAKAHCDVLVVKKPCSKCTGDFKSIIVAYDGSEQSRKALARAGRLNGSDGAAVTVLYVIPRYEEMVEFFKTDAIKNSLYAQAEKLLDTARAVAAEGGFAIAAIVQEGPSADRILDIAKRSESDLIVMGSHGWTGVNKAIMGSTTERVIMDAPCPVLIAR